MMTILKIVPFRGVLGALAILAAHGHAGAAATVAPGGTMPEALKGIRQASAVCRAQDTSGYAAPPAALRPDLGCSIGVSAALATQQRADSVMIDVRPDADYASFHIDGSLNARLTDLHSKPYWRGKAVVLVGSGKAERELYMECTRLKQLGYKDVKVLRGGMPAWLAAGQPVMGRAPAAPQLARLSASEFWLESQNPDNFVALGKAHAALQNDIASAVVLPQMNAGAIRSALERRRTVQKNTALASVIVVADAGTAEPQIEQLQQALQPIPVLAYTDSREAFARQLSVQKAVWSAQERGPKQPACGQ